MSTTAAETGRRAEQEALRLLRQAGLQLVTRNFHSRLGELDLVMRDADSLVFVEVRYRRQSHFGSAAESISAGKRTKLARAASMFLAVHPEWQRASCRFDAVLFNGGFAADAIDWQRDILQLD